MMVWGQSLSELFMKAGVTRWPLFICSVIGLAVVVDRGAYFLRRYCDAERFYQALRGRLNDKGASETLGWLKGLRHPLAEIALTYLRCRAHPARQSILSREATRIVARAERRLGGLAVIARTAPLLGLLGTVMGLVEAFYQIQHASGNVQAQMLAGGIWEALLSTVFGLVVAIPCMIAYHGYEGVTDRLTQRLQATVAILDEFYGCQDKERGCLD